MGARHHSSSASTCSSFDMPVFQAIKCVDQVANGASKVIWRVWSSRATSPAALVTSPAINSSHPVISPI